MSNIATNTIIIMIATMISKGLGFFRELCLGSAYGASAYTDAYIISLNIPVVIFSSIALALGTSYIPLFCDVKERLGEKQSIRFSNNIINIVVIACSIISIICIIFAKPIVSIFAMGFEGETLDLTIKFTRILMIGIIFIGVNDVIMPFLQVKGNFFIPGVLGVPYNIVIILSIFASLKYGIEILVYGTLFAIISKVLFQIPFAKKVGYKYELYINLKDEYLKKLITLVSPVFIGVAVNQINGLVDKTLASTLVEGSISALNYANKLNEFVLGLFITSICAVIYPMLSKFSSENNNEEFIDAIKKSINGVIILIIPVSIGAMVLSKPIVKLLFERNAFDAHATKMTAEALFFYAIGILGFGLRDVLSRVFYSIQDTKTPMVNGAMAMGINIVLNLILVKFFKHSGLALATSISSLVCIVLLFKSLHKKIGYFGQDRIRTVLLKSLVSGIVMGVGSIVSYNLISPLLGVGFIGQAISLIITVLISAVIYFIMIFLLKVQEVTDFILALKSKVKKKSVGGV